MGDRDMVAQPPRADALPTGPISALRAEVQSEAIKAFVFAWETLLERAAGELPARKELHPRIIMPFMSSCWLYSRDMDGEFFCVLTGETVRNFWRAPTRGRYLRDIIPDGGHVAVQDRLSLAIDRPCMIHCINRCAGKQHVFAERIYAPLARDPDGADYVFGCSNYHVKRDQQAQAVEQKADTMQLFDCYSLRFIEKRVCAIP
ncbi:hypothetical protein ACFOGJ_23300 [Marinibaculum pumilum]|uniref:PAS domain-containing protein n=1 Tax=Marinibaculum pumilum TaxID=1766165 RepID=A0ABV7L710_9PROT